MFGRNARTVADMDDFVRVGSLAEVPEGELRAYDMLGQRACVAHVGPGVYAIGDECTHAGCSLAEDGAITEDGEGVVCECHGSIFDLHSGEPIEGPATDPVPVYAVRVVDGWIEVGPVSED